MMLTEENSRAYENVSQESSDLMPTTENKFGGKSPMLFFFFDSQVIPRKAEEPIKGMELQEKEGKSVIGNLTRKNPKV